MSLMQLIIVFTCFVSLQYAVKDSYYQTDILWGNYRRPIWADSLQFKIDGTSKQVIQISGYVVPISSRGRGNIPLVHHGHLSLSNRERGHLLSVSNGGADIEYNVIPQPNEWQIKGGWAKLQSTIHNYSALTYNWDACMCHGAYTVQTVFNSPKPKYGVYVSINIDDYDQHGYPLHYYGFLNGTMEYFFNITTNKTAIWHPKPPVKVPHCAESSVCCDRWNCCEQHEIQQIWSTADNVPSSTILYQGDFLESNNGLYYMTLEETGNFSIYDQYGDRIWESNSGTKGSEYSPYELLILSDGSLKIRNNKGNTIWETKDCNNLGKPFRFIMENDGNLVLYSFGNIPCWSSNTSVNVLYDNKKTFICSSNLLINNGVNYTPYVLQNDSCIAEILMDGQFVINDMLNNNTVWSTKTVNMEPPPYILSVQMDGRMVLSGNEKYMWGVNSSVPFNVSTMQNFMLMLERQKQECMLTLYGNNMSIIWSSV